MTMDVKKATTPESALTAGRLKVAVLMGGISSERQISLKSGQSVAAALQQAGLNVVTADIAPDKLAILEDKSIDVFFIALHGGFGEDGQLQQILESKGLVYTGSGPEASRLAFDKWASKQFFRRAGVNVPSAIKFAPDADDAEVAGKLRRLASKYVIKPQRQGSTIGISIVDSPKAAMEAARKCYSGFGECLIEEYISGREVTVGILENLPLPILEIKSKSGLYDYQAKYEDEQTEFLFGTINGPAVVSEIKTTALKCFNVLGCRHFGRVDLILDNEQKVYALELNNVPGFTARSDLPKAAAKAGISMSKLCVKIIEAALKEKIIKSCSSGISIEKWQKKAERKDNRRSGFLASAVPGKRQ